MKNVKALLVILGLYACTSIGLTSAANPSSDDPHKDAPGAFSVSFWSINRYAKSTTDFEEVDDARNFTSEALFSESAIRLNRPLTNKELRGIIRIKEPAETFNNLRLSIGAIGNNRTDIDIFYKYRDIEDAQITNFFLPNVFNDVTLEEYGIAAQRWFSSNRVFLRGGYKRSEREGIIEFLPKQKEDIDTYEINAAIRFADDNLTNIVTLYPTYVFQKINPDIPDPLTRERQIISIVLTYGQEEFPEKELSSDPRPVTSSDKILERRFDPRGLRLYGGYVRDEETFGDTDVTKEDFFVGTSFPIGAFDLAIQPSFFSSEVEGDPTQDNAQYRTDLTLFYQATDKTLLILPFRHDVAVDGTDNFENWRIGAELRYAGTIGMVKRSTATWSMSLRYDHQSFYNLNEDVDLVSLYFKLGI